MYMIQFMLLKNLPGSAPIYVYVEEKAYTSTQ